ncbi:MAG: holin [Clostridia bacterium]|nr:holin [Clostridia bacterium]
MEFLENYVVLAVLGVCLCVGYVLKHLVPGDTINRYIPLVMAVMGALLNIWASGWAVTPNILLGGMVSGLASTGMYELFHSFIVKK